MTHTPQTNYDRELARFLKACEPMTPEEREEIRSKFDDTYVAAIARLADASIELSKEIGKPVRGVLNNGR